MEPYAVSDMVRYSEGKLEQHIRTVENNLRDITSVVSSMKTNVLNHEKDIGGLIERVDRLEERTGIDE